MAWRQFSRATNLLQACRADKCGFDTAGCKVAFLPPPREQHDSDRILRQEMLLKKLERDFRTSEVQV